MRVKKIFVALLSMSLAASLSACNESETPTSLNNSSSSETNFLDDLVSDIYSGLDDYLNQFPDYSEPFNSDLPSDNEEGKEEEEPQWIVAAAEDFEYEDNGDEIELTKYIGDGGLVIIPDTIDNKPVAVIAENAFASNKYLLGIEIPDSVLYIYEGAFEGCSKLKSAIIGNSVTKISKRVFEGCGLENIQFGDSISYIGERAFKSCDFTSINIPDTVTEIAGYAFEYCDKLLSIIIPEGVSKIGSHAFAECISLEIVIVPDTVEEIDSYVFSGCDKLISGISYKNKQYTEDELYNAINNNLIYDEDGLSIVNNVLVDCLDYTEGEVIIPNSVTAISKEAFYSCSKITNITIPESITEIGESSFQNCTNLISIAIPNSVTKIGSYCFGGCDNLKNATLGNGITEISSDMFYKCENLSSVTIPNSVTKIKDGAFGYCSKITDITIPDNVTSINTFMYRQSFFECKRISATYKGKTYDYDHISDLYDAINKK